MRPASARAARLGAAAASGLLLNAAFPPLDQRWVASVALIPFVLAVRGAGAGTGALAGLVLGATFFGILLHWISLFGYLAFTMLVLAQAVFLAGLGGLAGRLRGWWFIAGVPLLWGALELARSRYPLGGFSWGGLAYTQHSGGPLLPLARLGGAFVLGLAIVAINVLIAETLARRSGRFALGAAALLVLPGLLPTGLAGPQDGTIEVAAVQGNVPRGRFSAAGRRGRIGPEDPVIVRNHVQATEGLAGSSVQLVTWAENALDRDPYRNPELFEPVRDLARRLGAHMIVGAILDEGANFRNSNLLIDPRGEVAARYDKIQLVPFGEYVPWAWVRDLVPVLDRELPTDGIAGDEPVVFDVGGARVGTAICFESNGPLIARAHVRRGAELLVVTTNDASFGRGPAAAEHLAMSKLRAVENGRALVHTAISGISAIVMPDGEVVRRAGLFRTAVLRARLPLASGQTPYTRYGGWIEGALALGGLAMAVAAVRGRAEP